MRSATRASRRRPGLPSPPRSWTTCWPGAPSQGGPAIWEMISPGSAPPRVAANIQTRGYRSSADFREMQRRPTNGMGRRLLSKSRSLAALSGLRRPSGRLVLGLIALLAGPLLAGLATLLLGPLLRLRLPALFALLLLALAHRFSSCRMNSELEGLTLAAECIDYMSVRAIPNRPSARFHRLPQVSHGLGLIGDARWHDAFPAW